MFGSQDELLKEISNYMVINLIGANYLHESIVSTCLDIIDGDYAGKLRVVSLLNTDQLIYKNNDKKEIDFGLINMEWMKKTQLLRPATIILVYDIRNKPESVAWKDYENSIYIDTSKAKKMDNYSFFNIIVLIYTNSPGFSFDNHNEDKERNYNIKKIIDPKNLYYISGADGLKNISKKFSTHVVKLTVNYYRNLKKNLKIKKNNAGEIREKLIKYNIKLGIVAQIKNRRRNWKYFEEAYSYLSTLDVRNYYYGSGNVKLNYFEVKAVADWLFFKILYLKSHDLNTHLPGLVNNFNFYIQTYFKPDLFKDEDDTSNSKNTNKLFLVEIYWKVMRYEFFAKFLEDNAKNETFNKNIFNFPGYYYLLSSFNLARMIKFIKDYGGVENFINFDKNIKSDTIKIRESKFYGKAPKFYIQVDPLTEKDLDFDGGIYMKLFCNNFGVDIDNLNNRLNENLNRAQKLYSQFYLHSKENSLGCSTMTIFLNILSLISNDNYSKNYEKMKYLYKTFISSAGLSKFPKLHCKYLEEYNNILINDGARENFTQMLNNLISIAGVRKLNQQEEELFFKIITGDISKDLKQKFILPKNNKIISFNYNVNNNTPKIFEIIEYNFNFQSELILKSLKIKSINFFFNNPDRNKAFFENEFELSKNNEINLSYKILIKDTDKHLKLKSVRFEIITYTEETTITTTEDNSDITTSIFLEIPIKTEKEKAISIKSSQMSVLDFKYPKNLTMGVNQYYNFECEINKMEEGIDVDNVILRFILGDENASGSGGNISKSMISLPGRHKQTKSENNLTSSMQIEDLSIQNTIEESNVYLNKETSFNLIEHEFVTKDLSVGDSNEDKFQTHQNNLVIKISKIDQNPLKCNFLIKFLDAGQYTLKLEADYKILKKEIYDDTSLLKHTGVINFEVKVPFIIKHE